VILRRSVILALGSMPLLPGGVFSQAAVKARRVGLLSTGAPFTDTHPLVTGLTAGFSKRGYVVGSSLVFERWAAEVHPGRLPQIVDDLKSQAELIVTNSNAAARVVKDRSNVPVVAITGADLVATGLIDNLARPGGNITGVGEVAAELSAKRLEVLNDTFPSLRKIAMLWNADDLGMTLRYRAAEAATRVLGLEIQPLGVREPEDFADAFAAMVIVGSARASIARIDSVLVVPAVFRPLPHVTVHVVEPPSVRLEGIDGHGLLAIFALTAAAVSVVAVIVCLIAPPERRRRART
jgi:putative tryptophan/tyrosine transport system substrate-binding protein